MILAPVVSWEEEVCAVCRDGGPGLVIEISRHCGTPIIALETHFIRGSVDGASLIIPMASNVYN